MTFRIRGIVLALAVAVLLSLPAVSRAFRIDGFSAGGDTVNVTGVGTDGPSTVAGLDPNAVIGGSRTMFLEVIASVFSQNSEFSVDAAQQILILNNGSGNRGTGVVTWDANTSGLGGEDLTDNGASDRIAIHVLSSDLNTEIMVGITDTDGDSASNLTTLATMMGIASLKFDDFVENGGGTTDFDSVDVIQLTVARSPATAQDVTVRLIESSGGVPEPATMSLLGLGVIGFVRRRRA